MKLSKHFESLRADTAAIADAYGLNLSVDDGSKSGLGLMYEILNVISRNRAYDDNHPGFANGTWARVLPYDGRDYCWYYDDGGNDDHVKTLLKKVRDSFRS